MKERFNEKFLKAVAVRVLGRVVFRDVPPDGVRVPVVADKVLP